VVWVVKDILAKETKKNEQGEKETFYYVEWADGKGKPTWEPKATLVEDEKVAKMIEV
jgi:hypothetical protein